MSCSAKQLTAVSVRELFGVVIATRGVQVASHPPSSLLGCLSFLFPVAFVVGVHLQVEPSENQANGGHERRQKWCQCRKYGVWSQPPQSQSLTCPETGESYAYGFGAQHLQCSSKDGPGSQPFSLRSTKIEEAIRGGKNTNSSLITLCLLYL